MPRLRNKVTGAVVNVSEETAKRLDADWVSGSSEQPKSRAKKAAEKSED